MTPQQRKEELQRIIHLYESQELKDELDVSSTLEIDKFPAFIKECTDYLASKVPTFATSASIGVINVTLSHVYGQLRIMLDDTIYSTDRLGINNYTCIFSGSGRGKDNSKNAMLTVSQQALDKVTAELNKELTDKAKQKALAKLRQQDKDATLDDVSSELIKESMSKLPIQWLSLESTRGGVASALSAQQNYSLGCATLFSPELAMSLKASKTTEEVLQMFGQVYDMGKATAPAFKNEEVQEQEIDGVYPNLLAHTAPRIILTNDQVKEKLRDMFHTMLARRTWFIYPDASEEYANDVIYATIEESLKAQNAKLAKQLTLQDSLSKHLVSSIQLLLDEPTRRVLSFDEEAGILYMKYREYTTRKAEFLAQKDQVIPIEMSGRAFKVARLAAVYALTDNSRHITKKHLSAAIYFAQFTGKYLEKYVRMMTSSDYILLADYFLEGNQSIPLDEALNCGFIKKIQQSYKNILDPLNSYLRGKGIVVYNEIARSFDYEVIEVNSVEEIVSKGFGISCTETPGLSKEDRKFITKIDRYVPNVSWDDLTILASKDYIYNVFQYKDNKICNENAFGSTNLIVLDVDKSNIDLYNVHEMLSSYQHLICTTSDKENKNKFRIFLAIATSLSAEEPEKFKYVTQKLSIDLMLKVDPASFQVARKMNSYAHSEVLLNKTGDLLDIEEYLREFASEVPVTRFIEKPKTTVARDRAIAETKNNFDTMFSFAINAKEGQRSLELIRATKWMQDLDFTQDDFIHGLNYICASSPNPLPNSEIERTIIKPNIQKFREK